MVKYLLNLALQGVYLSRQLHGVPAEIVHGDGVVPVAQVVLLARWLLPPPHAAHRQKHGWRRRREEEEGEG